MADQWYRWNNVPAPVSSGSTASTSASASTSTSRWSSAPAPRPARAYRPVATPMVRPPPSTARVRAEDCQPNEARPALPFQIRAAAASSRPVRKQPVRKVTEAPPSVVPTRPKTKVAGKTGKAGKDNSISAAASKAKSIIPLQSKSAASASSSNSASSSSVAAASPSRLASTNGPVLSSFPASVSAAIAAAKAKAAAKASHASTSSSSSTTSITNNPKPASAPSSSAAGNTGQPKLTLHTSSAASQPAPSPSSSTPPIQPTQEQKRRISFWLSLTHKQILALDMYDYEHGMKLLGEDGRRQLRQKRKAAAKMYPQRARHQIQLQDESRRAMKEAKDQRQQRHDPEWLPAEAQSQRDIKQRRDVTIAQEERDARREEAEREARLDREDAYERRAVQTRTQQAAAFPSRCPPTAMAANHKRKSMAEETDSSRSASISHNAKRLCQKEERVHVERCGVTVAESEVTAGNLVPPVQRDFDEIVSEPIADDGIALEQIAEDGIAPESIAEDGIAQEQIAEDGIAPEQVAEDGSAPEPIAEDGVGQESLPTPEPIFNHQPSGTDQATGEVQVTADPAEPIPFREPIQSSGPIATTSQRIPLSDAMPTSDPIPTSRTFPPSETLYTPSSPPRATIFTSAPRDVPVPATHPTFFQRQPAAEPSSAASRYTQSWSIPLPRDDERDVADNPHYRAFAMGKGTVSTDDESGDEDDLETMSALPGVDVGRLKEVRNDDVVDGEIEAKPSPFFSSHREMSIASSASSSGGDTVMATAGPALQTSSKPPADVREADSDTHIPSKMLALSNDVERLSLQVPNVSWKWLSGIAVSDGRRDAPTRNKPSAIFAVAARSTQSTLRTMRGEGNVTSQRLRESSTSTSTIEDVKRVSSHCVAVASTSSEQIGEGSAQVSLVFARRKGGTEENGGDDGGDNDDDDDDDDKPLCTHVHSKSDAHGHAHPHAHIHSIHLDARPHLTGATAVCPFLPMANSLSFATGGADGAVFAWSYSSGKVKTTRLHALLHRNPITSIETLPRVDLIVSGSRSNSTTQRSNTDLVAFDGRTTQIVTTWKSSDSLAHLSRTPHPRVLDMSLLRADYDQHKLFDLRQDTAATRTRPILSFGWDSSANPPSQLGRAAFYKSYAVQGCPDGRVRLWDLRRPAEVLQEVRIGNAQEPVGDVVLVDGEGERGHGVGKDAVVLTRSAAWRVPFV